MFQPVLVSCGAITGHPREVPGSVCLVPSGFGLHGKALVVGEPTPDGFKTHPPLAKAELISDGGSSSGITFGKGENTYCETAARREGREDVRETTLSEGSQ